ncbi:MAG: 16S rRNA (guanine(527)-N(7))-methyltransferase RsmG [Bdellovibrionota bacterium]
MKPISDAAWVEAIGFLTGIGVPAAVLEKPAFQADCLRFLDLLLKKNEEVNLTGAKDLETLFWKHLVDSLAVLSVPNLGITADWGCGGGLPGIPIALARKHCGDSTPVYFVDSVAKKVRAVEEFCSALELTHTAGFVGRGEDLIRDGKLSGVNTVVMRAVAPAERAWKWVQPQIPHWLFLLGPRQREEWARELPKLAKKKMEASEERTFALPNNLGERCFLRVSKCST